jgi:uncharacterized protein (DUF488 family)
MTFYTIGVYNKSEQEFFKNLLDNNIDTFCDIRQRRGVRGSKYSFVNSIQLQEHLSAIDIKYGHIMDLAPTQEIRELQKKDDLLKGILKSERRVLGDIFISEYKDRILNKFNFEFFFEKLEQAGANKIVLFCVEEIAQACHRSIVAEKLLNTYHYDIINL